MSTPPRTPDASLVSPLLSVAVVGPDNFSRDTVINALSGCLGSQSADLIVDPAHLDDEAMATVSKCSVVIVELDRDPEFALELIQTICDHSPVVVMVYSSQASPDLVVRSMRAGAREFLRLPLEPDAMADALAQVTARRKAAQSTQTVEGELFVFLGAKGGAGVTTLASNFAVALAEESKKNTLLIDLNLPLGDAAINLGIKAPYSSVDALQNSARLDSSFLSNVLVRYNSFLSVLAAPAELTPFEVSKDAFDRLLAVVKQEFQYIVVDAGLRLDLQQTALFDKSATVYLVTQVGIPELRNANRLVTRFSQEDSPSLEIVLNRYESGAMGIPEAEITKALTKPAQWKVPNDYAAVRKMQNTATPLALEDSPISRTIRNMAKAACGKTDVTTKKKGFSFFR
jgi:pilus assembly protein CpaE